MRNLLRTAVLTSAASLLMAQNTAPDPIIKVSVDLVQIDAVVTDSQGRHVADLKPEDFQVFEDGKPQAITHFSFVPGTGRPAPVHAEATKAADTVPAETAMVPAKALRPEQVNRTIVLIADDLGLSSDDIYSVRRTMKSFVDREMQPGDLVSIMTTSGGMGAMQQLTNDKRQIYASIDQVRYSAGRIGLTWYEPVNKIDLASEVENGKNARLNAIRYPIQASETLGAMAYAIQGLRDMPGRKAVALFSGGFAQSPDGIVELANRASVVVYTFDPRGILPFFLTAVDRCRPPGCNAGREEQRRESTYHASQAALDRLARGTGGIFFHDNNDLSQGLANALDDMSSYYLLGYQPHREDFDRVHGDLQFHRIQVKVLRAALQVRSRNGFLGTPDRPALPKHVLRAEELYRAMSSPFHAGGIPVQLSAFYSSANHKTVLRAMMAIDAHAVKFEDAPDGKKRLALDIAAAAYNSGNQLVESSSRSFKTDISVEEAQGLIASGLVYSIDISISKPGAYQLRAAVGDAGSDLLGSATTFVQVPDFNRAAIALSSILLSDADPARNAALENAGVLGAGSPVTRVFAPGAALDYDCEIFGAHPEKSSGKPRIEIEVHLFRGPERIFTGHPFALPVTASGPPVRANGQVKLPAFLPPGDYALELIAWDRGAGPKQQATQWVDFRLEAAP